MEESQDKQKSMVSIDDFAKLEFKVGTIIEAEELEGSDKLLKLTVDFGNTSVISRSDNDEAISREDLSESSNTLNSSEPTEQKDIRTILSGIKQWYKPEELKGHQFVFITNLAPRKMMGIESQGMIMAAEGENKPIPLIPSEPVPPGSKIR